MNRLPASLLIAGLAAGFAAESSGQFTPAVTRETEAAIDRIVEQRLADSSSRIAALELRVEHLERVTYTGNGSQPERDRVVHTIVRGDTLHSIAKHYGVTVNELAETNKLTQTQIIYIGDRLYIPRAGGGPIQQTPDNNDRNRDDRNDRNDSPPPPGGGSYVVRPGDTLTRIARSYRTTVDELISVNGLPNAHHINIGQSLRIPGASSGAGADPRGAKGPTVVDNSHAARDGEETYHYYEVVQGDTLESISKTFFTSERDLRDLNKLAPNAPIYAGQQLVVPTARYFEYLQKEGVIS